ncbi:hypothetical protein FGADI_1028 [Fusarium gaditjirri]|uniref:Ankyrin n=1 Tax=Fusarium gaditjirri TaxID=282569 RepID=A0A8H4TLZ9_9HYPO|nr:hypothetical protein FGADI_1028 [Fusarium gaditjirri]
MSDQSPCATLPESIGLPRITSIRLESTLNYYGPVDVSLPTEASKFLARNTDAVEQELESKIKAFLETTQNDCSGDIEEKKACWLTIRTTKPCNAFKIPRWHQDGPMFEYDKGREDVVRSKYAVTLLGPSTLMLQPDEHVFKTQHEAEARYYWWLNKTDGPEPSEDEMYEADDLLRESLGNAFKETPRVEVGHGQIVRFSWGRDDSPVHSEPDLVSDRIFMTVLYASDSELRTMNLSRLSRVHHAFHAIFNPVLYKRNAAATGLHSCYPWTDNHDPQCCGQCPVDKASRSCLHWAVDHDSLSTIKLAVAYGSDINKINDVADYIPYEEDPDCIPICGRIIRPQLATPLHLAIFQKRFEIVRWLLDNGADTDLWPDALCNCRKYTRVINSTHEIFQLLLNQDVTHSVILDEHHISGLLCAIAQGSLPAIDALIQHRSFSPTHRDATGQTPLHWVKHCKDQDIACAIVEKLFQWGVPLNAEAESQWGDWHGGIALNMLIGRRKFEPALKLLQLGADPTIQQDEDECLRLLDNCIKGRGRDDMSNCPPDRAERKREAGMELLSLLIQKGIDPGRPRKLDRPHYLENLDFDEPRPLLSALLMYDSRCIQVLLNAGAMAREAIYENSHDNLLRDFVELMADAIEEGLSLREMRDEVELRQESVCLLLKGGARIDSRDGQSSALSKACEIEQGFGIVSSLAENATSRNAEVEYVVALRDTYRRDEPVWEKLDRFYHKLMAEKNELEGIQDIKGNA